MNLKKIHADYISKLIDGKTSEFAYQVLDDRVLLTDTHMFYLLYKKECFITLDDQILGRLPVNIFNDFEQKERRAVDAIMTDQIELVPSGKKKLPVRKFKAVNSDHEIFIDERYLKNFDKDATFKMDIEYKHPPLFVYECGDLWVGCILPVNRKAN